MKYIDAENLIERLEEMKRAEYENCGGVNSKTGTLQEVQELIDSLQQGQPEPYFYCKYGGIMPLCSDCKRNHSNSPFKEEEITTWYVPSCGTKQCIDYIQQDQPVDLEKELIFYHNEHFSPCENGVLFSERTGRELDYSDYEDIARHFYELGLKARKEE